ncbi:MAG: hypothetical protein ACRC6S_03140, partial [Shewanella sp.]
RLANAAEALYMRFLCKKTSVTFVLALYWLVFRSIETCDMGKGGAIRTWMELDGLAHFYAISV